MNLTKRNIEDAFWQLLEEKPYSKITVKDIADLCKVNRNTFYYYFQDIPTLTEHTIRDWLDGLLQNNFKFGTPLNCITPLIQECLKRQNALLHIYRSVQREIFLGYLSRSAAHIVCAYIDNVTKEVATPLEDKKTLIHFYKCTLTGIMLDWFEAGMTYDLLAFSEKICHLFAGSGKRAFLKHAEEPGA